MTSGVLITIVICVTLFLMHLVESICKTIVDSTRAKSPYYNQPWEEEKTIIKEESQDEKVNLKKD